MQSAVEVLGNIINESGFKAAIDKYREIRNSPDNEYFFDEREFNRLGYRLMNSNKIPEAIEIFKINVERYPNSGNVYDSLGEAYMRNGNTKEAIRNYEKSLEINPENTNARAMLENLQIKKD